MHCMMKRCVCLKARITLSVITSLISEAMLLTPVNISFLLVSRAFDQSLRSRNPGWGVRNLEEVLLSAEENGLNHKETIAMPANNLSVILQKS